MAFADPSVWRWTPVVNTSSHPSAPVVTSVRILPASDGGGGGGGGGVRVLTVQGPHVSMATPFPARDGRAVPPRYDLWSAWGEGREHWSRRATCSAVMDAGEATNSLVCVTGCADHALRMYGAYTPPLPPPEVLAVRTVLTPRSSR